MDFPRAKKTFANSLWPALPTLTEDDARGLIEMKTPNFDKWKEVVNGPDTYAAIASELADHQCCIVGWTDCHYTHHDVLFTLSPKKFGSLQGGLRGHGDLFVTIMRRSAFAFEVTRTNDLHSSYVAEKLGEGDNVTIKILTELINGVLGELGPIKTPELISE